MENYNTDVLWENEINANKVMVWGALATAVILVISWFLTAIEVFNVDKLYHMTKACRLKRRPAL